MKLNKIIRQFQFDKRLVEFNLSNHLVRPGEYKKYKDSLKDMSQEQEELLPSSPPAPSARDSAPSARGPAPSARGLAPSSVKEGG